ncbi:MAG TPA: TIGR03086 family metal-binding protein [Aldersonia sp.]
MTCTKSVVLPVGIEEAFALITQPERLRRWQAVTARVDLRVGGQYRYTVNPGHCAAGTYREIEPGRRIVFGWGWEGDDTLAPDGSTVTITVEPVAEGTRVTLVHEGLSTEQEARHAVGWDHYLQRLARAATDGDAGPDEWVAVPDPVDELTAAEATLAILQHALRGLAREEEPKQTPCAEFTCADLAEHLVASMAGLAAMAGASVADPGTGTVEDRIATMAGQTLEAWRSRGLDATVPGPGGARMPATFAASILPVEFLLHAWDLAQGRGRTLVVADELVAYVHKLAEQLVPGGRGSSFGEEVVPAADASPMQRLAAYTGRHRIPA